MDVGALRQVVEEVAQKKAEIGPIDIGINRKVLYATTPLDKLEIPSNTSGNVFDVFIACDMKCFSDRCDVSQVTVVHF